MSFAYRSHMCCVSFNEKTTMPPQCLENQSPEYELRLWFARCLFKHWRQNGRPWCFNAPNTNTRRMIFSVIYKLFVCNVKTKLSITVSEPQKTVLREWVSLAIYQHLVIWFISKVVNHGVSKPQQTIFRWWVCLSLIRFFIYRLIANGQEWSLKTSDTGTQSMSFACNSQAICL